MEISITNYSTVRFMFAQNIVDLTIDGAIFIYNLKNRIIVCISNNGNTAFMMHPKGYVVSQNYNVDINAFHQFGTRCAKFTNKGVYFTVDWKGITYLVDASGTKTSVEQFVFIDNDIRNNVFFQNAQYGEYFLCEAMELYESITCVESTYGIRRWKIRNIHILENDQGYIRITRDNDYFIKIIDTVGSVMIRTPKLHCSASILSGGHLFVRSNNSRLHYDQTLFTVRNEGQSAGIDNQNNLRIL